MTRRDAAMRRAFRCPAGHVTLSAVTLTIGRCVRCWPHLDWPDGEPPTIYAELTAQEWTDAGLIVEDPGPAGGAMNPHHEVQVFQSGGPVNPGHESWLVTAGRDVWLAERLAEEVRHLAADTEAKLNHPNVEHDRQYLLEDLLGRLVDLAQVLDPSRRRPDIGATVHAYPRLPRDVTVEYLRNGA